MTLRTDKCAWCGKEWQHHKLSSDATTLACQDGRKFAPYGTLTYKDIPVGSRIEYYLDDDRDIIGYSSNTMGEADLITDKNPFGYNSVLLAWTEREVPPNGAWDHKRGCKEYRASLGVKYTYGWWLDNGGHLHRVVSLSGIAAITVQQGGMQCAVPSCGTYNDYAQPNLPDGRFMCYSCKSNGYHLYLT